MEREKVLSALCQRLNVTQETQQILTGEKDGKSIAYYICTPSDSLEQLKQVQQDKEDIIFFFGIEEDTALMEACKNEFGVYGYYTAYLQGEDLFLEAGLHYKDGGFYDYKSQQLY